MSALQWAPIVPTPPLAADSPAEALCFALHVSHHIQLKEHLGAGRERGGKWTTTKAGPCWYPAPQAGKLLWHFGPHCQAQHHTTGSLCAAGVG